MNYDQRISRITTWFKEEIAIRFNMPRDIDAKVAAMDVIESMNSNIDGMINPDSLTELLSLTAKEVSRSAHSRTLPTVKMFVDAAKVAAKSHGAGRTARTLQPSDPMHINAQRVLSGQPVPEHYLTGKMRDRLLNETKVTEKDLEPYDLYTAAHKQ